MESGPCTIEASFFRGSRESGQGGHSFPCLVPMENRGSPKWFLDVDAPLLPSLRFQDYLHPPLQGTPLPPLNRGEGLLGFDSCFSYFATVSIFLAHRWEPVHSTGTRSSLLVLWSDIRQIFTSKTPPILITCHSEHTRRKPWLAEIITLNAYTDVVCFLMLFPSGFSSCDTSYATVLYIRGSVTLPPAIPLQSSLQPLEILAFAHMLNDRTFLCAWYFLAQNFQSQSSYIKQLIPFFLLPPSINNCSLQEWEHSVFSLMQHSHSIQIRFSSPLPFILRCSREKKTHVENKRLFV